LHASWTISSDAESGIAKYQYAIRETPGGPELVDWVSVRNIEFTATFSNLIEGETYYIAARAINSAGITSNTGRMAHPQNSHDMGKPIHKSFWR